MGEYCFKSQIVGDGAPIARDDYLVGAQEFVAEQANVVNVLANDFGFNPPVVSLSSVGGNVLAVPAFNTVNGEMTYTPPIGECGEIDREVDYEVSDGTDTDQAKVTFDVVAFPTPTGSCPLQVVPLPWSDALGSVIWQMPTVARTTGLGAFHCWLKDRGAPDAIFPIHSGYTFPDGTKGLFNFNTQHAFTTSGAWRFRRRSTDADDHTEVELGGVSGFVGGSCTAGGVERGFIPGVRYLIRIQGCVPVDPFAWYNGLTFSNLFQVASAVGGEPVLQVFLKGNGGSAEFRIGAREGGPSASLVATAIPFEAGGPFTIDIDYRGSETGGAVKVYINGGPNGRTGSPAYTPGDGTVADYDHAGNVVQPGHTCGGTPIAGLPRFGNYGGPIPVGSNGDVLVASASVKRV